MMNETTCSRRHVLSLLVASFIMCLLLVGCGPSPIGDQVEQQQYAMKTVLEHLLVKDALDADSLQFRNETLYHQGGPITKNGQLAYPPGWILCGEVNGKNGFGGHTGYRSFVAIINVKFDDKGTWVSNDPPMYQVSDNAGDNPLNLFCYTDENVQ